MGRKFTNIDVTGNASFTKALSTSVSDQSEDAQKNSSNSETVEENPVNEATPVSQETVEVQVESSETEKQQKTKEPKKQEDDKLKKKKLEFLSLIMDKKLYNWNNSQNMRIDRKNLESLKKICASMGKVHNVSCLINNLIEKFLKDYDDVINLVKVQEPEETVDDAKIKEQRLNELYKKMF